MAHSGSIPFPRQKLREVYIYRALLILLIAANVYGVSGWTVPGRAPVLAQFILRDAFRWVPHTDAVPEGQWSSNLLSPGSARAGIAHPVSSAPYKPLNPVEGPEVMSS